MQMGLKVLLIVFVVAFSGLSCCKAYKFYVGGRDGWVVKPSEDYNHWAARNRFQVNDTLFFKYKKGEDSVLVVTRDNYLSCNTDKPIQSLTGGDSEFKFSRSGPFYFISGQHCKQGQKLIVVVMAVRPRKSPPTPAPAETPAHPPHAASPWPASSPHSSGGESPSPSPEHEHSFAGGRAGGSLGLATLCLGVVGAALLLNN